MISLYKKFVSNANINNIPYQYGLSFPGHMFEYTDVDPSDPNIHIYTSLRPPKKPKKTLVTAIIAIVVVVIVVVAVVLVALPSLSSHSQSSPSPHFGFVSLSTVEYYANNTTFTESPIATFKSVSLAYELIGFVKGERVFFNSTVGNIIITVSQFSNSSDATGYYLSQVSYLANIQVYYPHGSYDSFIYSYAPKSVPLNFLGEAVGHGGDFVFIIVDMGIPISNFNGLIQAQISAMVQ